MALYKLCAENVRKKNEMLLGLMKQFNVRLAFVDDTFDSFYTVVIEGTAEQATQARDLIWEFNSGAYCGMDEITEDQYDEMC